MTEIAKCNNPQKNSRNISEKARIFPEYRYIVYLSTRIPATELWESLEHPQLLVTIQLSCRAPGAYVAERFKSKPWILFQTLSNILSSHNSPMFLRSNKYTKRSASFILPLLYTKCLIPHVHIYVCYIWSTKLLTFHLINNDIHVFVNMKQNKKENYLQNKQIATKLLFDK